MERSDTTEIFTSKAFHPEKKRKELAGNAALGDGRASIGGVGFGDNRLISALKTMPIGRMRDSINLMSYTMR
jgi:hypothetical protein